MKLFIFLLCFCVAFASQQLSFVRFFEKNVRIYDGEKAKLGDVPWQVAVRSFKNNTPFIDCGGSLIHKNFVLTAGHCAVKGTEEFELRFGSLNFLEGGTVRKTKNYTLHEEYDAYWLHNDVALIYFAEEIELSDAIKIVSLPPPDEYIEENVDLLVSGYGKNNKQTTNELYYVEVTTIDNFECMFTHSHIHETVLCCVGKKWKSPCDGDSGGPLVKKTDDGPVHVGVVSFVYWSGCNTGRPFGFARTASYRDWIDTTMNKYLN